MLEMKSIYIVVLFSLVMCEEFKLSGLFFGCDRDVTLEYHKNLQGFSTRLLKKVAKDFDHFALSQYSIWLTLSAVAESADGPVQKQLFQALNLPEDKCLREKYYEIATSLESPGNDVTLSRKRYLILDENQTLNDSWANSVRASGLIDTKFTPIIGADESTNQLRELLLTKSNLTSIGGSILIDTLNYSGLWTKAFENASIQNDADFYNDDRQKIGAVDLFRTKMRVKLAHIPLLNVKLLELPVGNNGRYRFLFIINAGKSSIRRTVEHFPSTFIIDSMPLLMESLIPLEVAIPKFSMSSRIDLKDVLERLGVGSIWRDPEATKFMSSPPAPPSTFLHQVTVNVDSPGLEPVSSSSLPGLSLATGLASAAGRGFIADRPFIYGLVDSQTRTWLFSGMFSKP